LACGQLTRNNILQLVCLDHFADINRVPYDELDLAIRLDDRNMPYCPSPLQNATGYVWVWN
jgi:hypothetical protein